MLSLPSRRKRVSSVRPDRTASAIRCSPSRPRRSPSCEAFPLKEARRALTRALDLLVMGAGAGIVSAIECVETQCTRRFAEDCATADFAEAQADEIKSLLGKTYLEG